MGWFGVCLAIVLPWLAGVVALKQAWRGNATGTWPLVLGYGYLLGLFAAALMLYLTAPLGLRAGAWLTMLVFVGAIWLGLWRIRRSPLAGAVRQSPPLPRWQSVVVVLLLCWLAVRVIGLALEVWWQPLFPWDAWTTWSVRARLWSETGQLLPFVSAADWLNDTSGQAHTLNAWTYPKAVSLFALWPTLVYGEWNETAANLPWLGCFIALGLGFYGQARTWGATPLTSTVFLWLLLSLPLLNAHVALAGYADLWLAATFGLSAIACVQWSRTGDRRQGVLALVLALCCPFIKLEGTVWIVLLIAALLAARLSGRWPILLLGAAIGSVILVIITGGATFMLPGFGRFELTASLIQVPLIGRFELGFHDSWRPMLNTLFIDGNWHLFAYALMAASFYGMFRVFGAKDVGWLRAELTLVLGSLLMLFVLFFFTDAYRWAVQSTSSARLMLHFMPLYVFYLLSLWAWPRSSSVLETRSAEIGSNIPR